MTYFHCGVISPGTIFEVMLRSEDAWYIVFAYDHVVIRVKHHEACLNKVAPKGSHPRELRSGYTRAERV